MRTLIGTLVLTTALAIVPLKASMQEQDRNPVGSGSDTVRPVEPDTPPPTNPPPPPPAARPAPPATPPQPLPQQKPTDTGQWVHTTQYGWVWMPYGDTYAHVPPDGSTPSMYVYYPEAGWCWVVAPWLWGWGPMPYFGLMGPRYYGWFGFGFGHWYGFARPYEHWGWHGRAYWGGGRWNGVNRFYGGGPGSGRGGGFRGGSVRGGSGGHSRGLSPGGRR